MNEVQLLGRLTKDPEITTVGEKNISKAVFTLAVDRVGKKDEADFPRIVAWGNLAENIAKYVGKGGRIVIIGHIQTGSYKDKGGNTVYTTDVVADSANFIDFKEGSLPSKNDDPVSDAAPSGKARAKGADESDMW